MVFQDESRTSWLWPLRRSPSTEKKALGQDESSGSDVERGFEIADAMEMGLAREFTTDFMRPLKQSSRLWKFHVQRSEDRQQYRLYCDDGEFLMFARASQDWRRVDFFLYDPRGDRDCQLYDPDRPAFSMTSNAQKTEWRLVKERCDNCHCALKRSACGCQAKQEVFRVRHSRQDVGDGTNHCMEVQMLPADGRRGQDEDTLVTKLPVWNDEAESLVLDFKGRRVLSSAKNFQLTQEEDMKHVVLQHCKIAPNTFSLDFRFPLTVIQAFGISLTTICWS